MIIASHMHKIIQIYPSLLKLLRKQESVMDGQTDAITISPHRYRGGIINVLNWDIIKFLLCPSYIPIIMSSFINKSQN